MINVVQGRIVGTGRDLSFCKCCERGVHMFNSVVMLIEMKHLFK